MVNAFKKAIEMTFLQNKETNTTKKQTADECKLLK